LRKSCHKKDQKNPRRQLERWKAKQGFRRLADVTPAILVQARDEQAGLPTRDSDHHSPASVVRYMGALSHAFTLALREWQWIDQNPFARVSRPKEPRGRLRYLSEDERSGCSKPSTHCVAFDVEGSEIPLTGSGPTVREQAVRATPDGGSELDAAPLPW
jgi:hypothetical protein